MTPFTSSQVPSTSISVSVIYPLDCLEFELEAPDNEHDD